MMRIEADLCGGWIYYSRGGTAVSSGGIELKPRRDGTRRFVPAGLLCDEGDRATIPLDADDADIDEVEVVVPDDWDYGW